MSCLIRRSSVALRTGAVRSGLAASQALQRVGHSRLSSSSSSSSSSEAQKSSAAPSSSLTGILDAGAKNILTKLVNLFGSRKEVEFYLKHYSSMDSDRFAVIKVGGGVLLNEMDVLVESLFFLHQVGLTPVVIHGGGPQLNDRLRELGIESDYIGGLRVTTPEIMEVARGMFIEENIRLVGALEARGATVRAVQCGVFEAEPMDVAKYGLVGHVTGVNPAPIRAAIEAGRMPILTCMGETRYGQALNVNADMAARALARAIQPTKVVYISAAGGLRDEQGEVIPVIDLNTDFAHLMEQPWFKHGDRLKLREIKEIMDVLPSSASVSITAARALPEELFTHKGKGTLVRRQDIITAHDSLDTVDVDALLRLIEEGFGGRLERERYLEYIRPRIHRIYVDEFYTAGAVVLSSPIGVPYLDKFAVVPTKQSEGTGARIWARMIKDVPSMYWRSRTINPVNTWYFPRSQGSHADPTGTWVVFWYGLHDFDRACAAVREALAEPVLLHRRGPGTDDATIELPYDPTEPVPRVHRVASLNASPKPIRDPGLPKDDHHSHPHRGPGRAQQTLTFSPPRRKFSSSSRAAGNARPEVRLALIGGRGHTGSELLRLLDQHSRIRLVLASSRALVGQSVAAAAPELRPDSPLNRVVFTDVSPEALREESGRRLTGDELAIDEADVVVLALPNKLAAPYVQALESRAAARGRPAPKLVDLSADYRFDDSGAWVYGMPERRGARGEIASASRVANPGCYATGMQVALAPIAALCEPLVAPCAFGVSGYSGAGTTPSRKNDLNELRDNLMPYSLAGHIHEREVSRQLRRDGLTCPSGIRFMPHVAPWFRGISLTVAAQLSAEGRARVPDRKALADLYSAYFGGERLIRVRADDEVPEVRAVQGRHEVVVGGFVYEPATGRVVVCSVLDNLLKGAATQCLQNVNLMTGCDELDGIRL